MRKIVTLLLISMMLFSVSANAKEPSVDFLSESNKNYTATGEIQVSLDEPIKLLEVLKQQNMGFDDEFLDYILLYESFFECEADTVIKSDISDDFKKILMSLEMDYKDEFPLNENFNVKTDMKMGMWMDIDFTNSSDPKFDIIISHPFYNKYIYIDYDMIFGDAPDAELVVKMLFETEILSQLYNMNSESSLNFGDYTNKNGKFTLKISDEQLDAYIADSISRIEAFAKPSGDMEELIDILSKVTLISKEGISETILYNARTNKISTVDVKVPVEINIYDILSTFVPEEIPEWLKREDSFIKFTITENIKYSDVGKTKNITMPALTEENSVSIVDLLNPYTYDEEYYEEYEYTEFSYASSAYPEKTLIENGTYYVPFRELVDSACHHDSSYYDISYDNGKIGFNSKFAEFEKLEFSVNSDIYYCDGKAYNFAPVIEVDGTAWVDARMFEEIFGWRLSEYNYEYLLNRAEIRFYI